MVIEKAQRSEGAGQELPEASEPGSGDNSSIGVQPAIRSLRELIERVSGRGVWKQAVREDSGLIETLPFPFLALVGQIEMKLALLLALINPSVGGVLLIGPRGTGKTTAIRSLTDLLPDVPRSLCFYGCMPEDVEIGGVEAVCPDCARKYAMGEPLAAMDKVRLVELPLNARLEDVVGGIDDRAVPHERLRIRRGILAQADRNLLHVDEVNLLADDVVDAILDAAAQGSYTVRRGPAAAIYRSRFVLIGSMNPEEGRLRPQIMDRFGLRVIVHGLADAEQRLEAYRRVQAYLSNPRQVVMEYAPETHLMQAEIQLIRDVLPRVNLPEQVSHLGLEMVNRLHIDSLRAEITMFEAARAYAALDGREVVKPEDLRVVAPMALRMRRSIFMENYFTEVSGEEDEIAAIVDSILPDSDDGNRQDIENLETSNQG
jgi:magnesium chelatase subunit I